MTYGTKSAAAALVKEGKALESFSHTSEEGVVTVYNVSAMRARAMLEKWTLCVADISMVLAHLLTNHDWEEARVMELDEASYLTDPSIVVVSPDKTGADSHLIVDGTHRIIRRDLEGLKDFYFYEARGAQIEILDHDKFKVVADWGHPIIDGKIQR